MENKYYTPEIDEFYIGFECEFKNNMHSSVFEKEITGSETLDIALDLYEHDEQEFKDTFRVKYLDREDIEELGWIKTWEEEKSYGIYFKGKLGDNEIWYAKGIDKDVCYVNITNKQHNGNCRVYIKNKSELKKLMKQLGIS